ncbi:DUF2892 domain-containing protein [Flavobacterium jejuense]|uniref:DUF2892 domain-containing protein n=1 Tax=Flavobacterium jejuense TaxID=1544455 RepID=A0ABX0IPQ8_9FLAO|nr:DUF2892 domain-containing protein [Flavobacterium jejuense]NHN24784.1 DUF2892 domain-containing protein [Flavobacterium jejuense]
MKKNIGAVDQMIRVGIAIIIATLYLTDYITGVLALILLLVLGVLIATSLFSFCPLYFLFKISTKKKSKYRKRAY